MRVSLKGLSAAAALALLLPCSASGGELPREPEIAGGTILHCFNWSYSAVEERLEEIARAGYGAVQLSPVQRPKDYSPDTADTAGQWWKLYQPLSLSVAPQGTTWLGGPEDLARLCTRAHELGLGVVIDVVCNHMANDGTSGGYEHLSPLAELQDPALYHHTGPAAEGDRVLLTQGHLGMPDLNTASPQVQRRALDLLLECAALGADGFRFDAAKHIELPEDPSPGDFWPAVTEGLRRETGRDFFLYGEILGDPATDIRGYTRYLAVTDNRAGDRSLYAACTEDARLLAESACSPGLEPGESVLWVESHDTFLGSSGSGGMACTAEAGQEEILRSWAITGARADSTALFFARPGGTVGEPGPDETWKSPAVTWVNRLKNRFRGESEYLGCNEEEEVSYIVRGSAGMAIAALEGPGAVSLREERLEEGVYLDRVHGGVFLSSGGTVTGTVGPTGTAVLFDREERTWSVTYSNPRNWDQAYCYFWSARNPGLCTWPGLPMRRESGGFVCPLAFGDTVPEGIIFTDGQTQTADLPFAAGENLPAGEGFGVYSITAPEPDGHITEPDSPAQEPEGSSQAQTPVSLWTRLLAGVRALLQRWGLLES